MRKCNKYFFKNKYHVFSFFFRKRIFKFKRPKWLKIKSHFFFLYSCFSYKHKKKSFLNFTSILRFFKNIMFIKKKKKKNFKLKFLLFFKKLKKFIFLKKYKNLIYRFKNSLFINKFLKKKIKRIFKFFFFNFEVLKKNSFLKFNVKHIFKNLLFMKSIIFKYFFSCISLKVFKKFYYFFNKQLKRKQCMSLVLLKAELRPDILLWRLQIFTSPYLARFACINNLILFNNSFLNYNLNFFFRKQLKGGDYLHFKFKYSFKKNLKKYVKFFFLPASLEIDYYSNLIILLKDITDYTFRDINSYIKEPLCIYKFKDYFLK